MNLSKSGRMGTRKEAFPISKSRTLTEFLPTCITILAISETRTAIRNRHRHRGWIIWTHLCLLVHPELCVVLGQVP